MKLINLKSEHDWPWDLLLLADPNENMVRQYATRGQVWALQAHQHIIAVMVILPTRPQTIEIMNLAVAQSHQGQGLAKKLLAHAKEIAMQAAYTQLDVATGNSSLSQLALYQKAGFRISHIEHDFFVKHYAEPIFENGIQCQDLIHLSQTLSAK